MSEIFSADRDAFVTSDPEVAEGEPILVGTRIRVAHIYAMRRLRRMSAAQIRAEFPHLTLEQISAAIEYGDRHSEQMRRFLEEDEEE